MNGTSLAILDLLTSGRILTESLYGVLKANPDDTESVFFSDAFSPQPDKNVISRWVVIPKSLIGYAQPLGTGYCYETQGVPLPLPNPYVGLWLTIPHDPSGAALAQLLAQALHKLAAQQRACECSSGRPWTQPRLTRCPTGVPDLCPEDCSVIAGTGITYETISTNRVRWFAVNGRQKMVRIYPLASSYQGGNMLSEACWPYVDVPAMDTHFVIGETTWPTGSGPITGTGIRMYHSFELP